MKKTIKQKILMELDAMERAYLHDGEIAGAFNLKDEDDKLTDEQWINEVNSADVYESRDYYIGYYNAIGELRADIKKMRA